MMINRLKFIRLWGFVTTSILCFSCASKDYRTDVLGPQLIPEIDALIVEKKNEFVEECFLPIKDKETPMGGCQFDLFQVIERRHGANYVPDEVDYTAEEMFFHDYVRKSVNALVRSNPSVRKSVKKNFASKDEFWQHYQEIYSFTR